MMFQKISRFLGYKITMGIVLFKLKWQFAHYQV